MNDTKTKLVSPAKTDGKSMEIVNQIHEEIGSVVEQVHPKTLQEIELEEERLNQRYFHLLNQLDRTRHQVMKLEEKLKQQNDLENHPQIRELVNELSKVDKYKNALISRSEQLTQALTKYHMTIKELKHSVYAKRLEIRDIVQDSWRTQAEILHYQEMFNDAMKMSQKSLRTKGLKSMDSRLNIQADPNFFLTASDQPMKKLSLSQLPPIPLKKNSKSLLFEVAQKVQSAQQLKQVDEIFSIYRRVDDLRRKANAFRSEVQKQSNRFSQIKNLLIDCVSQSVKHFKNRQKITNHNGYANSIYFDVSSANFSQIKEQNQSVTKERKIQNILYDTLQHIMLDMIDSQQRNDSNGSTVADSIIRNQVSMEQFMQFSSDQILGLLVLQPRLMNELISVFEIKQKQIGLLNNKLKIYQID